MCADDRKQNRIYKFNKFYFFILRDKFVEK